MILINIFEINCIVLAVSEDFNPSSKCYITVLQSFDGVELSYIGQAGIGGKNFTIWTDNHRIIKTENVMIWEGNEFNSDGFVFGRRNSVTF